MLKLYGYPGSRSIRAAWALEVAGADYEYLKIDLATGGGRTPEFLRLNPGGKVPVLIDGERVLNESAAILIDIGERYPASRLVPPSDRAAERASFWQWTFFVVTELEQPLWTLGKHRFALPKDKRVPAIVDTAKWEFGMAAKVLDQHLAGRRYIVGDSFTAADILAAQTLRWAANIHLHLPSAATERYVEAMLQRPAFQRALQRETAL